MHVEVVIEMITSIDWIGVIHFFPSFYSTLLCPFLLDFVLGLQSIVHRSENTMLRSERHCEPMSNGPNVKFSNDAFVRELMLGTFDNTQPCLFLNPDSLLMRQHSTLPFPPIEKNTLSPMSDPKRNAISRMNDSGNPIFRWTRQHSLDLDFSLVLSLCRFVDDRRSSLPIFAAGHRWPPLQGIRNHSGEERTGHFVGGNDGSIVEPFLPAICNTTIAHCTDTKDHTLKLL